MTARLAGIYMASAFIFVLLLGGARAAAGADPAPLDIGAAAPEFDLPGVDGKRHRLADFAAAKVLAVVFTCNHCPTAQAYEERLKKLHADYKERGAALVAISPNDPLAVRLDELGYTDLSDSLEEMKLRAKDRGFEFPYLYDGETQAVSRAFGVQATPHVFIFDAERKLRYAGRIDDAEVKPPRSHEARNAIDALLAGTPVPVEKTKVFGCSTKWSDKREDAKRAVARWDQEAVTLQPIDLAKVKELRKGDAKKLRLVNVWATWCGPCVAELPELTAIHRMYRRREFELVTISMDTAEKRDAALDALKKEHLSAANYTWSGESRDDFVRALDPQWEGPIPHTVLIAPSGKVLYRKTGPFDPRELKKAIADALGRTY
jgi:peroxiredoxin